MKSPADTLLCIKIASRGDLLLAAPTFRMLREARPDAWITLLVGASCEDVAHRLPYFDEVRVIDDRALFSPDRLVRLRAAGRILREMRRGCSPAASILPVRTSFSEVLIFHRDWRYALLARLAGIPLRRGLASGSRSRFLTHVHTPAPHEHDSSQYLRMALCPPGIGAAPVAPQDSPRVMPASLSLAGVWRFREGEREAALARAASYGFRPECGPWIALGFGGGRNVKNRTELKQWPLTSYRDLAATLTGRGCGVVWLGDAEDAHGLGEALPAGTVLAGELSVPESAAVLSACTLTVVNDTLLLHLSESVGTPTIGLFGPTDPAQYGPRGSRSTSIWLGERLACSPCSRSGEIAPCAFGHRCLRQLQVEAVLAQVEERLGAFPLPSGRERHATGAA